MSYCIAQGTVSSPGINHNGKEYLKKKCKKKNVYMCKTESLCCTAEICTTLLKSIICHLKKYNKKKKEEGNPAQA